VCYLLLAQQDKPRTVLSVFLPLSPTRNFKILAHLALLVRDGLRARLAPLFLHAFATRILRLGPGAHPGSAAAPAVREGIAYAEGRLLDVYLPAAVHGEEAVAGAAVVVYVEARNWRSGGRTVGRDVGMRLRRLGYAVIVPDLRGWPECRVDDMVLDLRLALEWTAGAIQSYGGDPEKIFLMVSPHST